MDRLIRLVVAAGVLCASSPSLAKGGSSIAGKQLAGRELQSLVVGSSIAMGGAQMGYAEHFRPTGEYGMSTGEWGATARGRYDIKGNLVCTYTEYGTECRSIIKGPKSSYYWLKDGITSRISSITRLPA